MTAAVRSSSRVECGSGSRRWRIVSRTPSGIRTAATWAASSSRPSALSSRTTSSTKNGLPSVASWIARTTRVGRAAARDALDDGGDVVLAQPAQRQPLAVADDVAERRGELRVKARLGLAVGADDEDRRVAHVHREEAEQQQRGVVGAVQVVEDEHERRLPGGCAQQRRDRIEELKAGGVGLAGVCRGGGALGRQVLRRARQPGDQPRQPAGRLRPERGERVADVAFDGQPAQDPQPRPVGRRAARSPGAPPQHGGAGGDRLGADRIGQRRLADPRIAGDHEQPAAAGQRALQALAQLGELPVAPHQILRAHAVRHRLSVGPVRPCGRRSRPAYAPTACGA